LRRLAADRRNTLRYCALRSLTYPNIDTAPQTAEGHAMRRLHNAKAKASNIRGTEDIRLR